MQKATQQQTKEHNRNLVLKTIIESESISRAGIARVTSLTRTTVSDIVSDLIAEGLVREVGVGSSLGGKMPILLSLVDDARYLIGLDLAHNKFSGAIINLRGQICQMVNQPVKDFTGEAALASVYTILDRLVETPCKPLVGIGIGTPGLVNANEGIVVNAVNLDWKGLPLARLLQDRYQLPVTVLNDSQAAAIGEFTFGDVYPPESSLVVINVRHGIGAGIIIKGELFHGDGGGAGEIGHIVVEHENGLPCRCGKTGCLETVASAHAVVQHARTLAPRMKKSSLSEAPQRINFDLLVQAFAASDPLARQVVLQAGHALGGVIASLVGVLNINRIILSGDMTRFGRPWLDAIQETMTQSALSRLVQETRLEIGQLGVNSVLLGTSALLLRDYSLLFRKN